MKFLRQIIIFSFLLCTAVNVFATHNRAGEITFRWVSGPSTYEIIITTYTKTSSVQADRPVLDSVYLEPNVVVPFFRNSKINLQGDISVNTYTRTHTFGGNGTYVIHFEDPNRNADIKNIPNSVTVPFYLESVLIINPFTGHNNSPVLLYPPIDKGCVDRIFIHNANAYDPDGDSLSYELIVCGGANGLPIPGYTFPSASTSLDINPVTGDLIWNSPLAPGEYNIAFNIVQWKSGSRYGEVRRDMQILIEECNDFPPDLFVTSDTCVLAGDTLAFDVTAIDPDHNNVILSASGGPFTQVPPDTARFVPVQTNNDTAISHFSWATQCQHIRLQPYYVQFKAKDVVHPDSVSLINLQSTAIRVIAPPVQNVQAVASGEHIDLSWDASLCFNVISYRIYRRSGLYPGTINCPCDNGAPSYTGYTLLGTVNAPSTTFTDDNNGNGLTIGVEYCYLITAVFPDGSESCASAQTCATLKKDAPVITNADVRTTDNATGSVYVAWSKPNELDTLQFPGPYEYRVYHDSGFFGNNFEPAPFATFSSPTFNLLNDTTVIDTLIDTRTHPWSYKVELYWTDPADNILKFKGKSATASTIYLSIAPTDNRLNLTWEEHVSWTNTSYDVYRQDPSNVFVLIATVTAQSYSDSMLANGTQYCYYVQSTGAFSFPGFVNPIINRSQQKCEVPIDNVSPCSPDLSVASDCINNLNILTWTNPNNSCADDVLKYYIYFAAAESNSYELLDSILNPLDTTYVHSDLEILAGCYRVTAIDSVGNETTNPVTTCVDTCRQYVLPSVFTPDGDGKNDLFHPCDETTSAALQEGNCPPYKNVKSVEIQIFNRWGNLVFETTDKDVNWNGKNQDSKQDCPSGVYFYTCKVFFFSVLGDKPVELHGTVELIRE
jgi:gliding motility-associated-like protein